MRTPLFRTGSPLLLTALAACSIIAAIDCKKSHPEVSSPPQSPATGPAAVNVYTISPDSGPDSTIVTISGSGFSDTASLDTVKINGVIATVTQATSSQLTVIVPLRAGTGKVSVMVGSQSGNGTVFTYDYKVVVTTLAGNGVAGFADGSGTAAEFNGPQGLTTDQAGNVYVMDSHNNRIRKITPSGVVTTLAGSGTSGLVDGQGTNAEFNFPMFGTFDNQGNMYVTDEANFDIRKITPAGLVSTVAGNGIEGFVDSTAANAEFESPVGIANDAAGNIYVSDEGNDRIRKITPSGIVSTIAGHTTSSYPGLGGGTGGYLDGPGAVALFFAPFGIAIDAQGNLYVADYLNSLIRKITPSDTVSTVAGSVTGYANGQTTMAQFNGPNGIVTDSIGNIYVSDQSNNCIRKITPSGVVTTFAGISIPGYADGNAAAAEFYYPVGIAIDSQGNIYVSDQNNRIRKISLQ